PGVAVEGAVAAGHAVVARGHHHRDAAVVRRLGADVDGVVGVVGDGAVAPRAVDHADVVAGLVPDDPVEARGGGDHVGRLSRTDADDARARCDPGVVAAAGGAGAARDAGDVGAVARGGVGVDHVLLGQ